MDYLLAIDTSTRFAAVGLEARGQLWEKSWRSAQNHGVELMQAVREVLAQADAKLTDLQGIAVATGPGGFSALRVGLATAKGLAMVRRLPLIGVSTYDLEAARAWPSEHALIVAIDAGSAGLAWARYEPGKTPPSTAPAGDAQRIDARDRRDRAGAGPFLEGARQASGVSQPSDLVAVSPPGARFCGEGARRLKGLAPAERVISSEPPTRRVGDLFALARGRWMSGDIAQLAALQPEYARPPSITKRVSEESRHGH